MLKSPKRPAARRNKRGNVWGELDAICRKIHVSLYEKHDKTTAKRYRAKLKRILAVLPESDLAIVREEGIALLHELNSETADAIGHRKREIELTERLHASVENQSKLKSLMRKWQGQFSLVEM